MLENERVELFKCTIRLYFWLESKHILVRKIREQIIHYIIVNSYDKAFGKFNHLKKSIDPFLKINKRRLGNKL